MRHKKFLTLLALGVCLFVSNGTLSAQKRRLPPKRIEIIQSVETIVPKLAPELQRRIETFNFVWQTIRNNYFDQTFSGLNWDSIKKEYEPRVRQTTTDRQLYDVLQEMVNRLGRSHFAVIPPEVYQAIEKAKVEAKAREKAAKANAEAMSGAETADDADEDTDDAADYRTRYGIGVDLRLIDEQFIITRVEKNSTAEKAGLKTGFVIEKINGVSLTELLKKLEIYYAKIPNIKKHLPNEISGFILNGEKDSVVAVVCLDENGQPSKFKVPREALKGETISIGKNFPEQYLKFETASLNEDVGLIKFNVFALPVIEKFCAALTEFKDKKAIIIDLRGNIGGILGSLVGLSGMLTEKSIDLGTSIYKVGSENLTALSKAKNYKGRIVFLVDGQTISAAEIFAAALQENKRAVVVGEKTAGEALPAISVALPTGAVLYYPIANFKTHNGNSVEGKGVEPDFAVSLDRKSLLAGTDAQLAAALKIIKEDTAFPKPNNGVLTAQGSGNAPPPPPRAIVPKLKTLAAVTVRGGVPPPPPAPIAPKSAEDIKTDEKAQQIINDFIVSIGGREAFDRINSYSLKGTTELTFKGTSSDLEIRAFRQKPDKYSEIWQSEAIGEVRQIYTQTQNILQSDYGLLQDLPLALKAEDVEIFAALRYAMKKDYFKSLKYQGMFDRNGKKVNLIEATTKEGITVALAFDVQTKLLTSFVVQYRSISFDDYRKVDDVRLPFAVEREGLMKIKFDEIKINTNPDADNFTKKINCYDKTN